MDGGLVKFGAVFADQEHLSMDLSPEPAGPPEHGGAVAPLRGLLELSRLSRHQPSLAEMLDAVARTVSQVLGFQTVAINTYHAETDEYEVVAVCGNRRARETLLGQISHADTWEPMLDPRFLRCGVYFIPEGSLEFDLSLTWYTPELRPSATDNERSWRADDALFATLDGPGGRRYGVISVDEPASGLRPDDEQFEVLSALAAHAALALESSRQLSALETALARNRAVMTSSLDCVIAVDARGMVLEFNPAAERTFGYREQDVLGRDIAELVVPPDKRDLFRRSMGQGLETDGWQLLDRRIETSAMRADQGVFPVELSVTMVQGNKQEGPILYGFVRDISERRRGEEQLTYLAYHDPLTGLPNRILVEQQLDLALARARRVAGAVALMFVDLDDFKEVNDRLGHASGDRLLTAVATRLRSVLRDSDLLARQGGDEFLVLLADLSGDPTSAAENVGSKMLRALREPFVVGGSRLRTGASIGVSLYPDDADDTEALLRHADAAMYLAKGAGGGRIAFHERSEAILSRRASLSAQLRRAMLAGELELHYQPIWCLGDRREITSVEALLRWRHPDHGMLRPDAFINLAEQSLAGDELVTWVLGQACDQAREWRDRGLVLPIHLNIAPQQLLAPGYVERFLDQLQGCGLQPRDFVIELTESAWSVDSAETLAVIARLRAAGVGLALDDFGAGYSSLSRLRDLGFDMIKIDRSLLVGVPGDQGAVSVLEAIFGLAYACDARVVVEGIETEEQVAFLGAHEIGYAQGFLFGHPLPAQRVAPLLARYVAREHVA
jgi:diguanylate cyclase (GGDEF)-like protein/PAS domain S-box-containing protein